MTKVGTFFKGLLVFLCSSFFCLLLVEGALRLFFPQISDHSRMFQYHPELGWEFIPNTRGGIVYDGEVNHYIETNSMGFRDGPASNDKRKTILVIGDSFVSNISVDDDDVFTEIMEDKLPAYEVMNFGVNGYGQVQEYLLMTKWINKINPDLVIVLIYLRNDFTDNVKGSDWLYARPTASWSNDLESIVINPLSSDANSTKINTDSPTNSYKKLHLYHFVRFRVRNLMTRLGLSSESDVFRYTPPELYLCTTETSRETELMFKIMEKLILKIKDETDRSAIPVIFALAPSIVQVEDEVWHHTIGASNMESGTYFRKLPNQKLMSFALENSIYMVDLFPDLYNEAKRGKTLYNPKEQHWNKEGNAIVARTLLEYIKKTLQ